MVTQVELDGVEKSDEICIPEADRRGKPPAIYRPLNRKMDIHFHDMSAASLEAK